MNYELFRYKLKDLDLKTNEDLHFPQFSEDKIVIWDIKEKRALCEIDKKHHYSFEFYGWTMMQEYWIDEKADMLIDLVVALAKTPIEER